MNVVFRADASLRIGTGHIMRCLTLAEALKNSYDATVTFICREHEGHLSTLISEKGFKIYLLPKPCTTFVPTEYPAHAKWLGNTQQADAKQTVAMIKKMNQPIDWLVVDHYGIEEHWHKQLRPFVKSIMVIDDLADRSLDYDLLLDQNFYLGADERYSPHLSVNSRRLLGPKYALLRDEFSLANKNPLSYENRIKKGRVVVFFGGVDAGNETLKALKGILPLQQSTTYHFDIIVGVRNTYKCELVEYCQEYSNAHILAHVNNMAELLCNAFLFIGAGGAVTLERCICAVPAIITAVAKNQHQAACDLANIQAHQYLGMSKSLQQHDYAENFYSLVNNVKRLMNYHQTSKELVSGNGITSVINALLEVK